MPSMWLHAHVPWRKATIVIVRTATTVVRSKAAAMEKGHVSGHVGVEQGCNRG
jgi:hypothetical protein